MEQWIVYCRYEYDALPWPFDGDWEAFVAAPLALQYAVSDFGRVSPCDGLNETPTVPAHLPRAVPRGRYQLAVYHDPEFLYVFLLSHDPPSVPEVGEDAAGVLAALALLTADGRYYYMLLCNEQGDAWEVISPHGQGPRVPPAREQELAWNHALGELEGGKLSCWRVPRKTIADAFAGNVLRLSVSRICFHRVEAVAWGSHTTWRPRVDEMGTVRLLDEPAVSPWPVVRRIDMDYDPVAEAARFRFHWQDVFEPAELTDENRDKWPGVAWEQFALRLNNSRHMLDLREDVESDLLPLAEGVNSLHIGHPAGPAVRLDVEKCSGNRIVDSPLPRQPETPHAELVARVRRECEAHLEAFRQGEPPHYRFWGSYHMASCGRAYHYLFPDDNDLRELLRVEADLALSLQRDDGSFSGNHLAADGISDVPWKGGAYDTGPAGELWVVAAQLLGDDKYLDASRRLVTAYQDYRVEFNHNYSAFALFHLAPHYRLTGDPLALEYALYYARTSAGVDIMPLGYQAGHNYYSVYGSITLRGLALLCAVMPTDHPYRERLREICVRMANQVITRLQSDGMFEARDRYYVDLSLWLTGLFSVAFLLQRDDVERLDRVFQRMFAAAEEEQRPRGRADRLSGRAKRLAHRYCDSDVIRYLVHREALLAGEEIDPAELL